MRNEEIKRIKGIKTSYALGRLEAEVLRQQQKLAPTMIPVAQIFQHTRRGTLEIALHQGFAAHISI